VRRHDLPRRRVLPSPWAILVLAGCILIALFINTNASRAQNTPSRAESSATIEDDPTLVPDSAESADNNVTFPVDI
jgi:hypothetical protein